MGSYSLYGNGSGTNNSALGYDALYGNTTGSRNTAVGYEAGYNGTTGSDNIFLGSGAVGVAGEANTIRIGGTVVGTAAGQQNRTFINGILGVPVAVGSYYVVVDPTGQLGSGPPVLPSSRRYKKEIRDMGEASGRVLELRPVTFRFKEESQRGDSDLQFGLIAEEVAEVLPELVVYDGEGRPERVDYRELAPLLLDELQKLLAALREQQRVNREQARMIERLEGTSAQLAELQARVVDLEASVRVSPQVARTEVRARPSPPPGTK